MQQSGLAEAVDAYALSGAEGIRKPEVGLFEIAAKRCGVTLVEGGWMIGDNRTADIAGGRAAGLRTIWIDRGTWSGVDHQADRVVTDVLQAVEILERHGGCDDNADDNVGHHERASTAEQHRRPRHGPGEQSDCSA
ncbi:HAD family hydrolase [Microbispora sp. NPDC049125]|uniref:HAD family hydrolase n=1 Tax=Microbispora sp. NPDC049125 TaxID=3154929 RepID=UPI003465A9A9